VKGFTLLEVMVSLAIMAGVLVTVLTSFVYHLDIAERDRGETTAMLLARARLDEAMIRGEKAGEGSFAPSRPEIGWKLSAEPAPWPGLEEVKLALSWGNPEKRMLLVQYREQR
jgi:general secretion pathway protein I